MKFCCSEMEKNVKSGDMIYRDMDVKGMPDTSGFFIFGETILVYYGDDCDKDTDEIRINYCPFCGTLIWDK